MDLSKYIDSWGLPGTLQENGTLDMGDSAAIWFNVQALSDTFDAHQVHLYFDAVAKKPVRHPDKTQWWGQLDRFSRDQFLPILCWAIMKDQKPDEVLKSHFWRAFLFSWNTRGDGQMSMPWKWADLTALEVWGLWLRIYKPLGYQLLLPICDLESLVDSMLWRWYQPETNQITRNQLLVAIAHRKMPSITSWIADKINNYPDLVARWQRNVDAVGEYPLTATLFSQVLLGK